jgi:hypothetical protein
MTAPHGQQRSTELGGPTWPDSFSNALQSAPPLGRLEDFFADHARALDITAEVVKGYIQSRLAQGAAAATFKNEVGVLEGAFALAYRSGDLPHRPYLPLPHVSKARGGFSPTRK